MKPLRDYKVSKGKVAGRVRLKLESADGEWQGWLSPKQAERLAADIFSIRFGTPMLEVILPPKIGPKSKRRPRRYITFQAEPKLLGKRSWFSEQLLDLIEHSKIPEIGDPKIRAKLEKAQELWDRKYARTKQGSKRHETSKAQTCARKRSKSQAILGFLVGARKH
jgi:hypothetical protein